MTEKSIALVNGLEISTHTLVWTAGTVPSPLTFSLPCPKQRGRLLVNRFLQVPEWPNVWAVGDCAFVPDAGNPGKSHPPTAQHAIREGRVVAQNIVAAIYGRPLRSFSFRTIGLLASIGRRTGVARIFGFNFSGFFAWWMWRTIYLSKLPGLDKKIRVAFDWTLDLLFPKDVCAVYDLDRQREVSRRPKASNRYDWNGYRDTTASRSAYSATAN
jgi:NADH dehydrogenase